MQFHSILNPILIKIIPDSLLFQGWQNFGLFDKKPPGPERGKLWPEYNGFIYGLVVENRDVQGESLNSFSGEFFLFTDSFYS